MNTKEIPQLYLKKLEIDPEGIAINNRRGSHLKRKFNTNIEVVSALYNNISIRGAAENLGYAEKGLHKALREKCSHLFKHKAGFNTYFNFINNFSGCCLIGCWTSKVYLIFRYSFLTFFCVNFKNLRIREKLSLKGD